MSLFDDFMDFIEVQRETRKDVRDANGKLRDERNKAVEERDFLARTLDHKQEQLDHAIERAIKAEAVLKKFEAAFQALVDKEPDYVDRFFREKK